MIFHAISGLPRSGSTLLAALLRQNPRFYAEMTSPVVGLLNGLVRGMSAKSDFAICFDQSRRLDMLSAAVRAYYMGMLAGDEVIFDTSRSWTSRLALLDQLFPDAKVICCVRDVPDILNSVEGLLRKNPEQATRLFDFRADLNVYSRAEILMNSERGFIGFPWCSLQEAWYGPFREKLILIEYDELCAAPHSVMQRIHDGLRAPGCGLADFHYDYENVEYSAPEFDAALGLPGCHAVHGPVERREQPVFLPPDLIAAYAGKSFWRSERKIESLSRSINKIYG